MTEKVADLLKQAAEALSGISNTNQPSTSRPTATGTAGSRPSSNSVSSYLTPETPSARQHVRSIFAPYHARRPAALKKRQSSTPEEVKWSHKFCVLHECDRDSVPSREERQNLYEAGLGEKKVTFTKNKDAVMFKNQLLEVFPKLKEGGGFDLLRSDVSARTKLVLLRHPPGGFTSQYLADESNLNQAVCYVRPIQKDLDPSSIETDFVIDDNGLKETCLECGDDIPVEILRRHTENCINESLPIVKERKTTQMTACHYFHHIDQIPPKIQVEEKDVKKCPVCNQFFPVGIIESHASVCADVEFEISSDDINFDAPAFFTNSGSVDEKPSCSPLDHVSQCVSKTLKDMNGIESSKLILNCYIEHFFDGDIDMMEQVEGSTSKEILRFGVVVDRQNIFEDMISEIGREEDIRYPLEVTFMGEEAADYGGPRREFLTLAIHSIKEKLVKNGKLVNEDIIGKENYMIFIKERKYEIAGTVAGLSLLEGGPTPRFFTNFEEIIKNEGCNEEERNFLKGLKRIGIFQLCREKQEVCGLFNEVISEPITYGYLTKLFKPQFSDEGSNNSLTEKKMYRNFLDYLKEVAAHRRGSVALEDVLRFVTGIEVKPLLGFRHQPTISFIDGESYLATSSTCTCTLYLPGKDGDREQIFNMFDYSFSNNYFGKA